MALLSDPQAKYPIHIMMGSTSDWKVGQLVAAALEKVGKRPLVHVLSCHRKPEQVRGFAQEFQGQAVICVGGMAFALPGVLESWFREFRKKVLVAGIPVGDNLVSRDTAVSAMKDLPPPCFIVWRYYNSEEVIGELIRKVVDYTKGEWCPDELTDEGWNQRLEKHHGAQALVDWKPEQERQR